MREWLICGKHKSGRGFLNFCTKNLNWFDTSYSSKKMKQQRTSCLVSLQLSSLLNLAADRSG